MIYYQVFRTKWNDGLPADHRGYSKHSDINKAFIEINTFLKEDNDVCRRSLKINKSEYEVREIEKL